MNEANLMAVQVWLKGERWREWACKQEPAVAVELDLALGALEQERVLEAGQALHLIAPSFQPIASRAQQHEGRRGQAHESEQERALGLEQGQAWACLHVMRSSEHECSEFRQARTGLQECDEFVPIAPITFFAHCDLRIVQHGAAVLSSATK